MIDRKGNPLSEGDRVYVLPEKQTRTGGTGWVRRIIDAEGKARVDNGSKHQSQLDPYGDWTWSAWVKPAEVEKV